MVGRSRFRLIVEYDGCQFHGWQAQAGARTVEGTLRSALEALGEGVETFGASRTDTGVHARGQCVLVTMDTSIDAEQLRRALNARTPEDITVRRCIDADVDFHPRHDAIEKRYLYWIHNSRLSSPFARGYRWWVRDPLDAAVMQDAAQALVGEHDFAAYRNRSKDEPEVTVRTISGLQVARVGDEVVCQVIGDGFLYRMVRNLVGTLVEVGRGRWSQEHPREVLESQNRQEGGPTAPPDGLYLMEIAYPGDPRCAVDSPDRAVLSLFSG